MQNGIETWEIAAWEKEPLMHFYNTIKDDTITLKYIQKVKPQPFIEFAIPNLTQKQLDAYLLAKNEGYYDIPKKQNLAQLAANKNLSRSTFQEHLRKAEQKIMKHLSPK